MISPANSAIDPVPLDPGPHVRVPSYDVVLDDRLGYVEIVHFDLHIHFDPCKNIMIRASRTSLLSGVWTVTWSRHEID